MDFNVGDTMNGPLGLPLHIVKEMPEFSAQLQFEEESPFGDYLTMEVNGMKWMVPGRPLPSKKKQKKAPSTQSTGRKPSK